MYYAKFFSRIVLIFITCRRGRGFPLFRDCKMASRLVLARSLRSRAIWSCSARRYASSSFTSGGSSNFNALLIGGGLFGGAVAVWVRRGMMYLKLCCKERGIDCVFLILPFLLLQYWRSVRKLDDSVGLKGLHGRKAEYTRMGAVHPEGTATHLMM